MKIYITLPFVGTTRNKSGGFLNANLIHDYEIHFRTTSRYKFKKAWQMVNEKDSGLSDSPCHHWIYTPIKPETFHIYQEGD